MTAEITPGLRANAGQFALLVAINALVGGMVGQERTVLPLLARDTFGIEDVSAAMTFVLAFGITKAVANVAAGAIADRYGRKPVLVAGWLAGMPVPLLLIWAPSWGWVVAANVLLGLNQGLTWSTTVIMKIDLVGSARRGLAMGLNEASGYLAVAATAAATGYLAAEYGLRPAPFLLGLAYAGLGLVASSVLVRETRGHVEAERGQPAVRTSATSQPSWPDVFRTTTLRDPSLSAATQAGLVNNLNDGMAWGVLPLLLAAGGLGVDEIGAVGATYLGVWGLAQPVTGALSDRVGRKPLIVAGMLLQAAAIAAIAALTTFGPWLAAAAAYGLGTAMVYPTLLAVVADVASPGRRASAVGVYRLWRDLGFAAGAIVTGVVADAAGLSAAIGLVAVLTAVSGLVVLVRMRESRPARGPIAA